MSELRERVIEQVDEDGVIELARAALRIPSLPGEEGEVARLLCERMDDIGMEAELQPVPHHSNMPGPSHNAIGRWCGSGGGVSLLFNGHMDHNPVCEGWTKDPFGADLEDGWLYGFVHMKAACACYVMAVDAVRRAGVPIKGDVTIANVCGELRGGAGTQHALANGLRADYFILGEPTELELATKHTASLVVDIHILGQMKHFATQDVPGHKGVNAVEKAAAVIGRLGPSHRPLPSLEEGGWLTFAPEPGFEGLPQLNIGGIHGGISRSHDQSRPALMPDCCTITVDIRIVPGMDKSSVEENLRTLLDGIAHDDPDFRYDIEFAGDTFPHPYASPDKSPVVDAVRTNHAAIVGTEPGWSTILKYAASDASWMSRSGIPGVVYGPTGKYLSRPDERGLADDFITVTKVYACAIADLCGRDAPIPA